MRDMATASEVAVRPATSADAAPVADLIMRLANEFAHDGPCGPGPDEGVLDCARRMLSLGDAVLGLIAEAGERPIGVLVANGRPSPCRRATHGKLTELYVAPDWRRRGVASRLIDEAVAAARRRGWTLLEVVRATALDHALARAVFRAKGFHPEDERLLLSIGG